MNIINYFIRLGINRATCLRAYSESIPVRQIKSMEATTEEENSTEERK